MVPGVAWFLWPLATSLATSLIPRRLLLPMAIRQAPELGRNGNGRTLTRSGVRLPITPPDNRSASPNASASMHRLVPGRLQMPCNSV